MPTSVAAAKKVTLENKFLRVVVLPEFGGKVTSLFDKLSGTEFLLQPTREYIHADQDTPFEESDRSGWDECLPTVSATEAIPDHGDLWRGSWSVRSNESAIYSSCDCFSRPLRLSRDIALTAYTLWVTYTIENLSEHDVHFLWSAHPLLAVSPGDRVVLPSSVDRVRIDSSRNHRLPGVTASWPKAGDSDLSIVPERDAATADKLFIGPLGGYPCGLYRTTPQAGLIFQSFPGDRIRYTGLWLCYGGWPEHAVGTSAAQYAVAIEPTTSPCDSLDDAIAQGTAVRVGAHSYHHCGMQIKLFNGPLERFIERCNRED